MSNMTQDTIAEVKQLLSSVDPSMKEQVKKTLIDVAMIFSFGEYNSQKRVAEAIREGKLLDTM